MNYLFFDIECATGIKSFSPICNFGYVLVNDNFEIIKQEDIIINPRSKFKLTGRKKQTDVILHYSEEEYLRAPTFNKVFEKIKSILESNNQIVFGHAVRNDIHFLLFDIERYHLNDLNFKSYDTQKIYKQYHTTVDTLALSTISEEFGMPEEHKHKADDDALKTMNYLKNICTMLDVSVEELLDLTNNPIVDFEDEKRKRVRVEQTRKLNKFIKNQNDHQHLSNELQGQVICFSKIIEEDVENASILIDRIISQSGQYTQKTSECTTFVHENTTSDVRYISATRSLSEGNLIEFIDLYSFQKMLFQIGSE